VELLSTEGAEALRAATEEAVAARGAANSKSKGAGGDSPPASASSAPSFVVPPAPPAATPVVLKRRRREVLTSRIVQGHVSRLGPEVQVRKTLSFLSLFMSRVHSDSHPLYNGFWPLSSNRTTFSNVCFQTHAKIYRL
jgi:hypothetical protein